MAARTKTCPSCLSAKIEQASQRCLSCYRASQEGPIQPPQPSSEPITSYTQACEVWDRSIGRVKARKAAWKQIPRKSREKILVVPDIHAPFHEPDMLARCLSEKADRAVVMGDVSDCYSLSRFVKYTPVSFQDEWAGVTKVMDEIAARYAKVDLIIGNHDVRLERQLRLRLDVDQMDAIAYMTGGILSPLVALASRYPNVELADHSVDGHEVKWFTTVGDAWFGHPEKYSRVPGSALRNLEEWIADNQETMQIPDCRLYVLAHTHQLGMFPWRANKLLVECGCLCKTQGYMVEPKIGGRPQRRGYVTFEQVDGKTLLNSVKLHWLDVE